MERRQDVSVRELIQNHVENRTIGEIIALVKRVVEFIEHATPLSGTPVTVSKVEIELQAVVSGTNGVDFKLDIPGLGDFKGGLTFKEEKTQTIAMVLLPYPKTTDVTEEAKRSEVPIDAALGGAVLDVGNAIKQALALPHGFTMESGSVTFNLVVTENRSLSLVLVTEDESVFTHKLTLHLTAA